ncbi:hypothetical protein RhiirC2_715769 [Rhizophagus irregularis]|uniref:Uncharacterized protein n=1 Tax=Rhizophagus irregularis TaxID=588596 RepID=A0A2N1MU66_9GLOM|nr:hypothetical protein RhiirC2_715769 [Rhizophagus irregularis]
MNFRYHTNLFDGVGTHSLGSDKFIICVLGFVGIILDNFLYVTIFVNYYLVAVYFYFAILSYYEKLREKNNRSGRNNGNGEVSASTYGAVSDQIFLLGKVDIHPNIIKLCEVSKFISKVVNENIGIIVATKLNNSLEIRIINGKREIPIPNTNSEYVKFYKSSNVQIIGGVAKYQPSNPCNS